MEEPDRPITTGVSHHSPAVLRPGPAPTTSSPGKEDNAMAMLADSVEVVIGVDTHKHTHTAAVLAAAIGQTLASLTVATTPRRLPATPRSSAGDPFPSGR
jgi:hypothetical protein